MKRKMHKSKKIFITSSLVSAGVITAGIAIGAGIIISNKNISNTNTNLLNPTIFKQNTTSGDLKIRTVLNEETNEVSYEITIANNGQYEFGSIKFYEKDELAIEARPGEKVKIEAIAKDDSMTIRDLIIYGDDQSIRLSSTKLNIPGKDVFEFTVPSPEDYQDGQNPFAGQRITIEATYIKKEVGNNINWTHGALFGDINAYNAYTLESDKTWSSIESEKGWSKLFDEDSRENSDPVSIVVFLNGHTLTLDKNIYVPKGYSLTFINNSNDTGKGKIVAANSSTGALIINSWKDENNIPVAGGNIVIYKSAEAIVKQSGSGLGIINEDTNLEDFLNYASRF